MKSSEHLVDLLQQQLFRLREQRIMGNIQRSELNTLIHCDCRGRCCSVTSYCFIFRI